MDSFTARLNERSTYVAIYAAIMASLPGILELEFPYNAIAFVMAVLGVFVPDGKVIEPAPIAQDPAV